MTKRGSWIFLPFGWGAGLVVLLLLDVPSPIGGVAKKVAGVGDMPSSESKQ